MSILRLMLPKGRIFDKVSQLLSEAGIDVKLSTRSYRPYVSDKNIQVKIMKPQNIPSLIELGSHDAGFTGFDWVLETGSKVQEILDLEFDPVQVVAAVPKDSTPEGLKERRIIVASEYPEISRDFLEKEEYNFVLIRTYGATEVFPPEDADMIIDNTSTGQTLRENQLKIVGSLLSSSTRFIANPKALQDPWKKEKIDELTLLFKSILDARKRVMLEMNVPKDQLEAVVKILPCMRSPTVSTLYQEEGFAVKAAILRSEASTIIPLLKKIGATDILEYEFRKVVV